MLVRDAYNTPEMQELAPDVAGEEGIDVGDADPLHDEAIKAMTSLMVSEGVMTFDDGS